MITVNITTEDKQRNPSERVLGSVIRYANPIIEFFEKEGYTKGHIELRYQVINQSFRISFVNIGSKDIPLIKKLFSDLQLHIGVSFSNIDFINEDMVDGDTYDDPLFSS